MTGTVNGQIEATIRIRVIGIKALARAVTAVIDTGYSGSITLPPRVIKSLGLRHVGFTDAELGDGRIATFAVFEGVIAWGKKRVAVEVDDANTGPLVGMELLKGSRLMIDVERGGAVTISRLR